MLRQAPWEALPARGFGRLSSVTDELRIAGRVITSTADLPSAEVVVVGDRIVDVREVGDAPADVVVLPGLVDLHCHGGGGASFTSADLEQVYAVVTHHAARGTTTLLGSAVSDSQERMLAVVATLADAVDAGRLAGVHIEGPFLSAARCGAQDPTYLRSPDLAAAAELLDAGRGHVRVMTMAPELPGADDLAAMLGDRGVVAAVGHTDADARTAETFLRRRGGLVTHLFNGMPALHHRDPGAAAGALASDAPVELIADGVHVADQTVALVLRLLGDRVLFVSDAMAAAGMPDGEYVLGPQRVTVTDGVARLTSGGSIAGGTTSLLDQVRRQIGAGLDPVAVVGAASAVPAAILGLPEVGSLSRGKRADVVVADQSWVARRVMRSGHWVN